MKRGSSRGAGGLALLAVVAGLACNDEAPPPSLARFDRPNRVAFVCARDGDIPVPCMSPSESGFLTEFALVTQSAPGEIAAVDLTNRKVLDSRRDIPGFTYVPVGETPIAIQVPALDPTFTYVADYGSRDVRVLLTQALIAPISIEPTVQIVQLRDPSGTVVAPTDLILSPDEDALIVAAPDAGVVYWLPLSGCGDDPACPGGPIALDGVLAIPLADSIGRLQTSQPVSGAAAARYEQLCDFPRPEPPPVPVPELPADIDERAPRPVALTVDRACAAGAEHCPRVLIADEALPLIHALDTAMLREGGDPSAALLDPLFSGTPTRALAATPIVPTRVRPVTLEEEGETVVEPDPGTSYVYAIDASDGSVLVLENGRLVSVNEEQGGRPDRIPFERGVTAPELAALAIDVVTPSFDPTAGPDQWLLEEDDDDPTTFTCDAAIPDRDPARLFGVFLAVAMSDGTVRIVDVHDMGLRECRGCGNRPFPALVRHQARLAINLDRPDTRNLEVAPRSGAAFLVNNAAFDVRSDGTSGSPQAPGLECIACQGELVQSYPSRSQQLAAASGADNPTVTGALSDGGTAMGETANTTCGAGRSALVCRAADPWAAFADTWIATYEGFIPGTFGGNGVFIPPGSDSRTGGLEFITGLDSCAAGVLGDEDIAAAFSNADCAAPTPSTDDDAGVPDEATPPAEPEPVFGDQLVIGTRPFGRARLEELGLQGLQLERCAALRDALEGDDPPLLAFGIRRAYADRLVVSNNLVNEIQIPQQVGGGPIRTYAEVAQCMPGIPVTFSVRSRGAFTVLGAQSGFLHRVRANQAGRCVIDPDVDPLRQGRARLGCTFRNPDVQFRFRQPSAADEEPEAGVALRVAIESSVGPKLVLSTNLAGFGAVVPVQLRYNPVDQLLYLVDINARGLVPIPLNRFQESVLQHYN